MRVVLDKQEAASIIIGWAKEKYKTHNVSVEKITGEQVEIMVTMGEEGFVNASMQNIQTAVSIKARLEELEAVSSSINGPSLDGGGI